MNSTVPRTPYQSQPPFAFWRRAVSESAPPNVDPVANWHLSIDRSTKVATAGSCFAQHIARRLKGQGFNFMVTEPAPSIINQDVAALYNYGVFSARYGNIYTSRQLMQLFLRAYGVFQPTDDIWIREDGRVIDPFRPNIQPNGFSSMREFELDRSHHFAAVRRMFEKLDVFVFTFGLTECWTHREDGAVYPLCPGVAGGIFDPMCHAFVNLGVEEVVADMREFLRRLRLVNPLGKIILTVSPVPLVATAEPAVHVLTATTYSKSVLRVAAEVLRKEGENIHYFPSYEIITGAFSRGNYYADDLRTVTEQGVDHVMRLFFHHASRSVPDFKSPKTRAKGKGSSIRALRQVVGVICDENSIEQAAG